MPGSKMKKQECVMKTGVIFDNLWKGAKILTKSSQRSVTTEKKKRI